jgi:hypothetical protein
MKYNRLKYSSFTDGKDIAFVPFDESFVANETLIEKLPEWLTNFRVNYDTIGFKETISNLPKINGPALIIDHPFSGSFERQAKYLKRYKGVSFCCDRALYKCLEYDFIPTYVVNVDSSYLCMSFFDRPDVRKVMDKVTAIFANTTFPLTIRCWSGRRVFFTPMFEWSITESMSAISRTDIVNTGGCVHNTCLSLAYTLDADPITIYGIDNSYDKIEQTEYPDVKHNEYYVEELGRSFVTDPVYEYYAKKMFQWISTMKRKVINTTENGIMYNSVSKMFGYDTKITKMRLSEFVRRY